MSERVSLIYRSFSDLKTHNDKCILFVGVFNYLCQNFSHSPCADLSHAFVVVMTNLMLAQAQECIFEKNMLGGFEIELGKCISVAQEAATVWNSALSTLIFNAHCRLLVLFPSTMFLC